MVGTTIAMGIHSVMNIRIKFGVWSMGGVIGVSLSEPHIDVLNTSSVMYVCTYVFVRHSVSFVFIVRVRGRGTKGEKVTLSSTLLLS